jgi:hypothetical protein
MTRLLPAAVAPCLALAAGSLALGHEPVYDAWAWLVWGRELAGLTLDVSSGPSWKPLTVALALPLSAAGDAAPELWVVLVRTAWLLAVVLAAELAVRLSPVGSGRGARLAAAGFAALCVALLSDPVTTWARQGAAGMSEPLLVALVLAAVRAHLDGRPRLALLLGALAGLLRPEVWPPLAAYGLWRWRDEPAARPLLWAVALALPALWLGPDLLTSGDALSSAGRAQRGGAGPLEVLGRAAAMPLAAAWPLALAAAAGRDRRVLVLGAGALAWIATVAAMTAAGFPGLPRFMAPAAAVVGVLGGAGLARLAAAPRRPAVAALAAALAVAAIELPGRVAELPRGLRTTDRIAGSHDRLRALAREVGRRRLLACGDLATSDVLVRTALAWQLRVPLSRVVSFGQAPRDSGAFVVGPQAGAALRRAVRSAGDELGARGEWRVYSLDCPAATAGVTGARR